MAFASTTIWEIQTSGSDTANGGGFDPNNSNFATDLMAASANTSSPVVSSASYSFVSGDIGAYLYIKSGTNWIPGWYQIASVSSGSATLSMAFYSSSNAPITTGTGNCSTTGSPTGGTWGIDYSISSSSFISYSDLVIDATTNTNFTSSAHPVGKNLVGNIIAITGGTGFTVQRIQIVSVSGTTGTADKSLGTLSSTGGTGNLGGALASLGQSQAVTVTGNSLFLKSGTYTISSATAAISGGKFQMAGGGSGSTPNYLVGYSTNRIIGNNDTRPVVQPSVNSITLIYVGAGNSTVRNIEITNPNSNTSIVGIQLDNNVTLADSLKISNVTTGLYISSSNCTGTNVLTSSCTTGFNIFQARLYNCVAIGGTVGFSISNGLVTAIWCIATGQSSSSFYSQNGGSQLNLINCVANNTVTGFNGNSQILNTSLWINCIASNCTTGFSSMKNVSNRLVNCLGYNNTSNFDSTIVNNYNCFSFISTITDPFVSSSSNDFRPSLSSQSRAAGYPSSLQGTLNSNYPDIGTFQHQDTGTVTNNILVKSIRRVI